MARHPGLRIDTIARGLEHPWALAFLPDGRFLVTERPGRLRTVTPDGRISRPITGVPEVFAREQGGLLDLLLAPDFATSRLLHFTFAERGEGRSAGTAVARARLDPEATALDNVEIVFRQEPKVGDGLHFGARLAPHPDGTMFLTLGERWQFDPAQDLGTHLGKVLRLRPDGSAPPDNPFVGRPGAKPEVWSYGHRNIQAAAVHPATGDLWVAEMGPMNGDELNLVLPGNNYGWPLVSWGSHYDGTPIPKPSSRPDLTDCVHQWTPVISPSGMCFYTGDLLPAWRGSLLIGGLSAEGIVRVSLRERSYAGEERIPLGGRVRDVRQGPDGAIYAVTDEAKGELLRVAPDL